MLWRLASGGCKPQTARLVLGRRSSPNFGQLALGILNPVTIAICDVIDTVMFTVLFLPQSLLPPPDTETVTA